MRKLKWLLLSAIEMSKIRAKRESDASPVCRKAHPAASPAIESNSETSRLATVRQVKVLPPCGLTRLLPPY
jgi:hypothetical protein